MAELLFLPALSAPPPHKGRNYLPGVSVSDDLWLLEALEMVAGKGEVSLYSSPSSCYCPAVRETQGQEARRKLCKP